MSNYQIGIVKGCGQFTYFMYGNGTQYIKLYRGVFVQLVVMCMSDDRMYVFAVCCGICVKRRLTISLDTLFRPGIWRFGASFFMYSLSVTRHCLRSNRILVSMNMISRTNSPQDKRKEVKRAREVFLQVFFFFKKSVLF